MNKLITNYICFGQIDVLYIEDKVMLHTWSENLMKPILYIKKELPDHNTIIIDEKTILIDIYDKNYDVIDFLIKYLHLSLLEKYYKWLNNKVFILNFNLKEAILKYNTQNNILSVITPFEDIYMLLYNYLINADFEFEPEIRSIEYILHINIRTKKVIDQITNIYNTNIPSKDILKKINENTFDMQIFYSIYGIITDIINKINKSIIDVKYDNENIQFIFNKFNTYIKSNDEYLLAGIYDVLNELTDITLNTNIYTEDKKIVIENISFYKFIKLALTIKYFTYFNE